MAAIVARLVGKKDLPTDVMAEIVERTDGIPLFVEEMTKAVLEAERDRGPAGCCGGSVSGFSGPSKFARFADGAARPARPRPRGGADRRSDWSQFLACLLTSVMGDRRELAGLDRLIQAGLLFRQGVPPYASYLFKHALVQDAAYGMLLREPRRALHARIAETLERQFAEIAESQPELLARHYTEAGLIEKAAGLWGKAGERSLARSALVEAAAQLTRALEQMATLRGTAALRSEQIKLQSRLRTL